MDKELDESALVMLARIDENVIELKRGQDKTNNRLDDHIKDDKDFRTDYIKPLWEKHQQDVGAQKQRNYGGAVAGWAINAGIAAAASWAMIKGLSKP